MAENDTEIERFSLKMEEKGSKIGAFLLMRMIIPEIYEI